MSFGIMAMMAMGGSATITLDAAYTANSTVTDPVNATAQFELTSGGDIRKTSGNNTVGDVGDWLAPKFGMSGFDAMLSVNSGSSPTGAALAMWLNLGTTRNWQLAQTEIGTNTSNCTLQIRNAASLVVQDTSTITFSAEVSP